MKHLILVIALLITPVFGQRKGVDNLKSFRQDLAAAVANGSLSQEEKQQYDKALESLDRQRQARKSGGEIDRAAARQALQDLVSISKSPNLKEEDRAKLEKHISKAKNKAKARKQA
jgi:hypothetical protein